jgi:hypothetical protein
LGQLEQEESLEQIGIDERDAVYDEWLRSKVKASMSNRQPSVPIDEAFKRARRAIARKGKGAKRGA